MSSDGLPLKTPLILIITGCIFILTLICALVPFLLNLKFHRSSLILSYLNCAAGGVVLSTFIMHMIPHALIACSQGGHDHKDHHDHHDHGHDHEHHHDHHDHHDHDHLHDHGYPWGLLSIGISFLFLFVLDRLFLTHTHCDENSESKVVSQNEKDGLKEFSDDLEMNEHKSCHSADVMAGCHMEGISNAPSRVQALLFVIALSIHSSLEGLALVTQKEPHAFLIGLFAHKWLEAFALGVAVLKGKFKTFESVVLIVVYSLLTPVGIGLGVLISYFSEHGMSANLSKVLNGFAGGSFLFVSCIEMIPPEFHTRDRHTPFKILALCVGFAAMAGFAVFHH